jgi:hypothetical protein
MRNAVDQRECGELEPLAQRRHRHRDRHVAQEQGGREEGEDERAGGESDLERIVRVFISRRLGMR